MSMIKKKTFYGETLNKYHAEHQSRVKELEMYREVECKRPRSHAFNSLEFWGEYPKQHEALIIAHSNRNSSLCTFVYQNTKGFRKFVVAHPETYWRHEKYKLYPDRCSYEVIPETAPCHLYFDLEYQKDINPSSHGSRMTQTLIDIFCKYIFEHWGYLCKRSNVLSLDSSTNSKFSRHLIFRLKNLMFKNNIHVGRFVKHVCADIEQQLLFNEPSYSKILSQFNTKDLQELFINISGKRELFVDKGVYTRNRHFRIYKATKWGKNAHLVVSPDTEYISNTEVKDKDLETFLDSLVSYVTNEKDLVLLESETDHSMSAIKYSRDYFSPRLSMISDNKSQFPSIDKFILQIVNPGKIRDIKHFGNRSIIYEIMDNRYCANINRQHKGNNVKWIVDIRDKIAYQKCHDIDCSHFKSLPIKLPAEITFQLNDDDDRILSSVPDIKDCDFQKHDHAVSFDDSFDAELACI